MEIDKIFEKKNKITKDAIGWGTPMKILNVALIFGAIMLLGLMDFATVSFDFSQIVTGTFWGKTLTKAFAYSMVYFSSSSTRTQSLLVNDIDYQVVSKYVNHVARKSRSAELNKFLLQRNLNVKKSVYKELIDRKLDKLEKYANTEDLIAWRSYKNQSKGEIKPYNSGHQYKPISKRVAKHSQRYIDKKLYLLSIREDKYIEDNIDILKVKFAEVKEWQLKSGKNKGKTDENPLASSGEMARTFKSILVIFRVVAFGGLMSAFLIDLLDNPTVMESMIGLVSTCFMTIWTALSGNFDGKGIFDDYYKYKMDFRFSLFKDYVDFEKENNNYIIPPM